MKVTLDTIKADITAKYAPLEVDLGDGRPPVVLVQLMRLPSDVRTALIAHQSERAKEREERADDAYNEGETLGDMHHVIRTVASPADAERLLAAIGDDIALLLEIVTRWREATQAGEAESSAS